MQEADAQQAKQHFMSLLFAGSAKMKKADDGDNDKANNGDEPVGKANGYDVGEKGELEEGRDVQIVGHGHRAKEQKKIDDLFRAGGTTPKKRKLCEEGKQSKQKSPEAAATATKEEQEDEFLKGSSNSRQEPTVSPELPYHTKAVRDTLFSFVQTFFNYCLRPAAPV
jgi:hypothetical protein